MGKLIQLNEVARSQRPATAAISQLQALARAGKLPLPTTLILERVPSRDHPRLLDVWSAHQDETEPYLKRRNVDEIVALAAVPSQLFAIVAEFEVNGEKVSTLAGHYALDDREKHIELSFDRSFLGRLGLHRLSIDYRLSTAALSLVVSGRDRDVVPIYASIYEQNERSRANYRQQGAVEISGLPGCMRRDGETSELRVPEVLFTVFTPEAVLAAFKRMLEVLRAGRINLGGHDVAVKMSGGEIADIEVAQRLLPDVERMCELHARYGRLRKYYRAS